MSYWVYENRVINKTRIHVASCSYCQDGRGIHGGGQRSTGSWSGPLSSLDEARRVALGFGRQDNRSCLQCIPNAEFAPPAVPSSRSDRSSAPVSPAPALPLEDHTCLLGLRWETAGEAIIDAGGKIEFPKMAEMPGLYSLRMHFTDGKEHRYIGESENLRRRFGNYRNPGPTQTTSIRISGEIQKLLAAGGRVKIAIATDLWLGHEKAVLDVDLTQKSVRRLFENLAISLDASRGVLTLNL